MGRRVRRRRGGRRRRRDGACCSSAPSSSSRARARSASRRCARARSRRPRTARPWSCSRAATSTRACSPASRGATRPPRGGGCASSRASTTGPAGSRGCSRGSPRPAATSSRSTTCARRCRCTCARPASTCVLETRGAEHAAEIVAALDGRRLRGRALRRQRPSQAMTVSAAGRRERRARRRALAELLRRPRFEVLPLDGIEEQVLDPPRHGGEGHRDRLAAQGARGDAGAVRAPRARRLPGRAAPLGAAGARPRAPRGGGRAAAGGGRARAVRAGRRRRRAGRVRRRRRAARARWGRCATRFDEIGITGYPETPPPDLRRGDDPGDVREGADGDVHHQPDLLRRGRDRRLDRGGPAPRHRAADLDRAARHRRLRQARAHLDEDRARASRRASCAITRTGCRG